MAAANSGQDPRRPYAKRSPVARAEIEKLQAEMSALYRELNMLAMLLNVGTGRYLR